jgi:hypothetical protein
MDSSSLIRRPKKYAFVKARVRLFNLIERDKALFVADILFSLESSVLKGGNNIADIEE